MSYKLIFFFRIFIFAFLTCFSFSCEDEQDAMEIIESDPIPVELEISHAVNPSGFAPLSVLLAVKSDTVFNMEITVIGQHGTKSDYKILETEYDSSHLLNIHGLYANYDNQVEIIARDELGNKVATDTLIITTLPLIDDMPLIEVEEENLDEDHPIFYLINYWGYDQETSPHRPFLVDQFGDIRWYLDFQSDETLSLTGAENGLLHLQNNDVIFGRSGWDILFISDLYGDVQEIISLGEYKFHHAILEKPDGNLLVTVTRKNWPTVEDIILEIDPRSNTLVHTWDLSESLDVKREVWIFDNSDWLHVNGIAYDESDNTIVVSGRHQGLFKVNYHNEVQWILAPHKDWATSGNGVDLNTLLLQPLDQNGENITNQQMLDGYENHPDFEWNWFQHSPIILPNGNIMCFDNGSKRNFDTAPNYSRAVEYEINQEDMTVQQVWSYGKELGEEVFSHIVSKVCEVPESNNIIFAPGAISQNGPLHGRIYEVDKTTNEVKLNMKITPPNAFIGVTFHNAQRFDLGRGM